LEHFSFISSLGYTVTARRSITILAGFLAMALPSARADWRFDAETGPLYDSNLSKSDRAADEADDWAWRIHASAGNGMQLSRDLRWDFSGELGGQVWHHYDAFDSITVGGSTGLRYRFGLGRQAPWLTIRDRLAYQSFQESQRSGLDNEFRIGGGIGITDRISVEAEYLLEHFAARDGFFDETGHNAIVRLVIDVTSSLQVALSYGYRYGDVISSAIPPRPDILLIASQSKPITSFDGPFVAYRLPDSSTHSVSVSAGYALTKSMSIQVGYQYLHTSHDQLEYENHVVEAKFVLAY
jgi:hypothetical protein